MEVDFQEASHIQGNTMCLKVLSDHLDTWVVTLHFNLALGKSCHFHAAIANVF